MVLGMGRNRLWEWEGDCLILKDRVQGRLGGGV